MPLFYLSSFALQNTCFSIMMVHATLNVTIFATRGQIPCKVECQHITQIAAMLRNFFMNILAKHFCFMSKWTCAEGMLGIEGYGDILHSV